MTDWPGDRPRSPAKYGDFPFALSEGPTESPFLTWLRNHSNYMAVGGFLDYLRIAAVLARGIFINALIFSPPLLLAAIALSFLYPYMHDRILLTPLVLALAVGWVLLFPVATMLSKIAGYKKSLASGSDSSVESRDRYERSFAIALLLVLGAAVFELLPHLVDWYHRLIGKHLPWREYLALAATAIASLSAAPKLLSVLSGRWQMVAVAVIAVGSVIAPLALIVVVAEYLVFQGNATPGGDLLTGLFNGIAHLEHLLILLLVTPAVFIVGILFAMATGYRNGTFSAPEYGRLSGLLASIIGLHLLLAAVIYGIFAATAALDMDNSDLPLKLFVLAVAVELWLFGWLTVDINQTSVHALYRDRLASAFLLGVNARGQVDIEEDVPLGELCYHEAGSTAPYHLINVALNLQGSADIGLRDRHSDFFIFSKKFIGGERTGYCRSASMEQVFPQVNLASAMAISAAAASPNMGRSTSPALVAFMTMINMRLGVWVPHPGRLEEDLARHIDTGERKDDRAGFTFAEVFVDELRSVRSRWELLDDKGAGRGLADTTLPTTAHGLAGIAFSGGGIRSATFNLGIAQAFHQAGLFHHFDYMSTVSGGGYLGSSISTLMRFSTQPVSEIEGRVSVEEGTTVVVTGTDGETRRHVYTAGAELVVKDGDEVKPGTRLIRRPGPRVLSEIGGTVRVQELDGGRQLVTVSAPSGERRDYRYTRYDDVAVEDGQSIAAGDPLVKLKNTFADRFRWRVRPQALLLEMAMRLDEKHRWVNLSDGGHIENLATIELLRRRCRIIVIGDGECDPQMYFAGLATLLRTAYIDLGVHIEMNLDALRLKADTHTGAHLVLGRIVYPGEKETGWLLYLKASCTGDEDEVIGQYRHKSPTFPHETTADQFFNEGQFEAYRALGQHIGEAAITALGASARPVRYADLATGLEALWQRTHGEPVAATAS